MGVGSAAMAGDKVQREAGTVGKEIGGEGKGWCGQVPGCTGPGMEWGASSKGSG